MTPPLRRTADRHRRTAWGTALALVLAPVLAGCGGGGADGADGTVPAVPLPAAEGTTQYPLSIETWAGSSVLDERPERIAVIGFSPNRDALEAIGVTPVYMLSDGPFDWSDDDYLAEVGFEDSATRGDPINVEAIAATEPDLIVATNFIFDQADYDKLVAIAPVLETAERIEGTGARIDWRATQLLIGETLDLGAAAADAVSEADAAVAATAERHPEFAGTTATIAYDYGADFGGIDYYTETGGTGEELVLDLGFSPNPLGASFTDDPVVADENLGLLDADVLVVFYDDEEQRATREAMGAFQIIPAVAEGRYHPIVMTEDRPGLWTTWVMRRGASTLSVPWAIDHLAQWLSGDTAF